jgi:mannosyltransferase OCH1-like enzyme
MAYGIHIVSVNRAAKTPRPAGLNVQSDVFPRRIKRFNLFSAMQKPGHIFFNAIFRQKRQSD